MSLLGELLLQKTNAANQRQNMIAEMKARGIIQGLGVLGPGGESPIDDATIDSAGDELNKLVGKSPEGKGFVQQFTGLVKHLHGRVRGDQGQPGSQGGQQNPQGAGALGAPPPGDAGAGGATGPEGPGPSSAPAGSSPSAGAGTGASAQSAPSATPMLPPPPPPPAGVGTTALPGPYATQLPLNQESQFQQWVKTNKIPWQDSPTADYDMRGYWQAQQGGDQSAATKVSQFDGQPHFPDTYKTPYHKTFSNESKYATKDAPHWEDEKLVDSSGKVVADETPSIGAGAAPATSPAGAPAPPSPFNFGRFVHQTAVPRSPVPGTPEETRYAIAHGKAMADASGFKLGSREYAEIFAHQNLPSVLPQRKGSQILGSDLQQSYPGIKTPTGEDLAPDQRYDLLFDSDGNMVASPSGFSAAATKPGTILYTDADGKQQVGRMVGGQPLDGKDNPLPPGTQWAPYERGLVSTTRGTTSTDQFGNVTHTQSTIAPNVGGAPVPPGVSKSKGATASPTSGEGGRAGSAAPSAAKPQGGSSKLSPLDQDGHIPPSAGNPQVVEAANQLLDGTDKDKLHPAKVMLRASALARQYGWEQDKFTPKEQNMLRVASTFIDQAAKDASLSVLDEGTVSRMQLSQAIANPDKENILTRGLSTISAQNMSPKQAAFVRMYNQLVGTISGLSQLVRSGRATEATIERLKTELPNPTTTKDAADGRARIKRIQEEIKVALQKGSFTDRNVNGSGGGGSAQRATPNLPPPPSGPARTADDLYNKLYGTAGAR